MTPKNLQGSAKEFTAHSNAYIHFLHFHIGNVADKVLYKKSADKAIGRCLFCHSFFFAYHQKLKLDNCRATVAEVGGEKKAAALKTEQFF